MAGSVRRRWRASVTTQRRARELRKELTPPELDLWRRLRGGQLFGFRFRKQHGVGPYIVDFFCAEARLVVELDGDSHAAQTEYDLRRTRWLSREKGYRVLRVTNRDVIHNIEGVLSVILEALQCC